MLITCLRRTGSGLQAALQPINDAEEQLIRNLKAVERDLHASPGSSQAQALQQKARGLQEAINAHVEHVSACASREAALHAAMQCLSRPLNKRQPPGCCALLKDPHVQWALMLPASCVSPAWHPSSCGAPLCRACIGQQPWRCHPMSSRRLSLQCPQSFGAKSTALHAVQQAAAVAIGDHSQPSCGSPCRQASCWSLLPCGPLPCGAAQLGSRAWHGPLSPHCPAGGSASSRSSHGRHSQPDCGSACRQPSWA